MYMKSIRLLIFDLDGTLVNTLEDIADSVNYTLGRLGRPPHSPGHGPAVRGRRNRDCSWRVPGRKHSAP